jgi:hypothetical protein
MNASWTMVLRDASRQGLAVGARHADRDVEIGAASFPRRAG